MSIRFLSFCLIAAILLAEGSVVLWQQGRRDTSHFPVFSWPQGLTAPPNQSKDFKGALAVYQADRGSMVELRGPDKTRLTAFYFEWDHLDAAPLIAIGGHAPEVCNAAAGYHLIGRSPPRIFSARDVPVLPFDTTHFASPGGQPVHVFKLAWLQGFGAWELTKNGERMSRLQKAFRRNSGAGRVLEAGVFGARDEDHAWAIFQSEILKNLTWKGKDPL